MNIQELQLPSQPTSRKREYLLLLLFGWIPSPSGKRLRNLIYKAICPRIGHSVWIEPGVKLVGARAIALANHTQIDSGTVINTTGEGNQIYLDEGVHLGNHVRLLSGGDRSIIHLKSGVSLDRGVDVKAHDNGYLEVGERTYLGPYVCMTGPGLIKIGKDCMIASHSSLYANNHIFSDPTRRIIDQGCVNKGIVIEDDCWLGSGVRVLDGVTIGRGCVIGAGAVVTKDIPPNSVAVGVPAKVISKRTHSVPDVVSPRGT